MSNLMKQHSLELEESFNKKLAEKEKVIKNLTNERDSAFEESKLNKK